MYHYKSRKRASLANIFCCTTRIASTFFCSTNQIVAKFVRHASHSIGRSKNFYETLSEFLNFCTLADSWDIFRQCDLKKKTGEIVCLEKQKRLWLHWRCWKLKEKSEVDIILLSTHVFFPQFFFMIQQKEGKIGFFTVLWSRLQDSLGFHLHTHITIIISSALYLLKSAIKTEWLQKIPRVF